MKLLIKRREMGGYNIYLSRWLGFTGWWGNLVQFKAFGFIVVSRLVNLNDTTALVLREE